MTQDELDRIRLLIDIRGREGVRFSTRQHSTLYMTIKLPPDIHHCDGELPAYGSKTKTIVVALTNCSMAGVKSGQVVYLDNDTPIEVMC